MVFFKILMTHALHFIDMYAIGYFFNSQIPLKVFHFNTQSLHKIFPNVLICEAELLLGS
jgi:hypothetical protein